MRKGWLIKSMKVNNFADRKNGLDGAVEDIVMGIDSDNHLQLLNSLTHLYGNPIMAAFREYCANAADAHKAIGQEKAFEVNFPHYYGGSTVLRIRDYGNGMTKEQLTKVYSQYGASTKGNDNTQVGGFGLGSKSGLAVSNTLHVNTVSNGVLIEAQILKNKDNLSVIRILSEEPTTNPSGTEILLPITSKQEKELQTNAENDLVGYAPKQVKLNNSTLKHSVHNKKLFIPITVGSNTVAYVKRNDTKRKNNHVDGSLKPFWVKYSVIMGSVYYPGLPAHGSIDIENQAIQNLVNGLGNRFGNSPLIILNVPVGSVDLPPHRDSIIDTEKTWNTILGLLGNVQMGLDTSVDAYLNTLPSLGEAGKCAASMRDLFVQDSKWKYKGHCYETDLSLAMEQPAFIFYHKNYYSSDRGTIRYREPAKESFFTPLYCKREEANYATGYDGTMTHMKVVNFKVPSDKYKEVIAFEQNEQRSHANRLKLNKPRAHAFMTRYLKIVVPDLLKIKDYFVVVTEDNGPEIPEHFKEAFDLTIDETGAKAEFRRLNPVKKKTVTKQSHCRLTSKRFEFSEISSDEDVVFFGGKGCYGTEEEILNGITKGIQWPSNSKPAHLTSIRKVSNGSDPHLYGGAWLLDALRKIVPNTTSLVGVSDGRSPSVFQKAFKESVPLGNIVMSRYDEMDDDHKLAVQHAYSIVSHWTDGIAALFSVFNDDDHGLTNESVNLMFKKPELVGMAYYLFAFKDNYVEGLLEWKKNFISSMEGKELAGMTLLPVQCFLTMHYSYSRVGIKDDGSVINSAQIRSLNSFHVEQVAKFVDKLTTV